MPRPYNDPSVQYNDLLHYNESEEVTLEQGQGILGYNSPGNFVLGFAFTDDTPFLELGAVIKKTLFEGLTLGASIVRDLSDAYQPITAEEFLDDQPASIAYVGFGKERSPGYGAAPTFYLPLVDFNASEGYDAEPMRHIGQGMDAEYLMRSARNITSGFSFVPSSMGMATLFSSLLWGNPLTSPQGYYYLHEIRPDNAYNSISMQSGVDNQYVVNRYGMLVSSLNLSCAFGEAAQAAVEMEGTLSELRDRRWSPDYYRTRELSFDNAQILQDDVPVADIISFDLSISNSLTPYRPIGKKMENNGFYLSGRDISVSASVDARNQTFYSLMREDTDFKIALELADDTGENFVRVVLSNVEITAHENSLLSGPQNITAIPRQPEVSPILVQIGNHFTDPV